MATLTGVSAERDPRAFEPTEGAFHETRSGWLVLGVVWTVCAVYLGVHLRQGWFPSDSGTLAEMADRVLRGQVPYRDFGEQYTGGLTYLNALAFRLFGVNLFSLRIPLFLFFLGWVPSLYFVARRFAGPIAAGAVTLLAVAWSVPTYPEAMPSWYNLFFATWGVLALLRYMETERQRWLWIAGLCTGLSFLVKITALYFVAAALLFFVFRELLLSRKDEGQSRKNGLLYRLFASAGLLAFLAVLANLVSQRPLFVDYAQFAFPSACLVAILLWVLWRGESGRAWPRFRRLLTMGFPFVGGFLAPITLFLVWFAEKKALSAWFEGTFASPASRFQWAAINPRPIGVLVGLIPAVAIVCLASPKLPFPRRVPRYASLPALAGLLILAWKIQLIYLFVGNALPFVIPVIAVVLVFALRHLGPGASIKQQKVFLLPAAAVCFAVIQFPFSATVYFSYVAPLAALAVLALVSVQPRFEHVGMGSLLAFYLLFAIWLHTPAYLQLMHTGPGQSPALRPLHLQRAGGLLVRTSDAEKYERLVRLVREHVRGPYIYCTPDCPEVYFLSGLRNPTRTIFDALDPDFLDIPARNERILGTIDQDGVTVVAIRTKHILSAPIPASLRAALDSEFPRHQQVGAFEVRWK